MSETQHIVRIVFHLVQVCAALTLAFLMWKLSRTSNRTSIPKEQVDAVERCIALQKELEKRHLDSALECRYYK